MFYYEGLFCPVCDRMFTDEDDIVVCPKCGLPHHRTCWSTVGHCFEQDKHDTPEQWSRHQATQPSDDTIDEEESDNICLHCGMSNSADAERCSRCGYALNAKDASDARATPYHYQSVAYSQQGYSTDEKIGSANAAEIAAVVGNNTHYYLQRFRNIERGSSGGWNWAAFLLSPYWLFYRKQYGLGLVYLATQFLYSIAAYFASPIILDPLLAADTPELLEAATLSLYSSPIFWILWLISAAFMALHIVIGLRANFFYLRHCERVIHKARTKTPNISVAELSSFGGVSYILPILSWLLTDVIIMLMEELIKLMG